MYGLVGCSSPAANEGQTSAGDLLKDGFCAGISCVELLPGETMHRETGPDFNVYRIEGQNGAQWGIYWGNWASSSPDRERVLVQKSNIRVYRALNETGHFDGYLAEENGEQNHFFGSAFTDTASDASFFDRVQLGSRAKQTCAEAGSND